MHMRMERMSKPHVPQQWRAPERVQHAGLVALPKTVVGQAQLCECGERKQGRNQAGSSLGPYGVGPKPQLPEPPELGQRRRLGGNALRVQPI